MRLPKLNMTTSTRKASKYSYDTEYIKPEGGNQYIVIHSTANDGDTAKGNTNYFSEDGSNTRYAGAHGFVDDYEYIKSVPLSRAAWAVGGKIYAGSEAAGGASFHNRCTNYNSISIEMCDTMKDGVVDLSAKTFENCARVVAYYSMKYGIPDDHIIRHWDVTGKPCPSYMIGKDNVLWKKFKERVAEIKAEVV